MVSAHGFQTSSSRRFKANIESISEAVSLVERLRGVTFERTDQAGREVGLIAEEVAEVVPEVVAFETDGTSPRSIDYSRPTAILIEAVKQQQAQIRELQTQLKSLQPGADVSAPV